MKLMALGRTWHTGPQYRVKSDLQPLHLSALPGPTVGSVGSARPFEEVPAHDARRAPQGRQMTRGASEPLLQVASVDIGQDGADSEASSGSSLDQRRGAAAEDRALPVRLDFVARALLLCHLRADIICPVICELPPLALGLNTGPSH